VLLLSLSNRPNYAVELSNNITLLKHEPFCHCKVKNKSGCSVFTPKPILINFDPELNEMLE
jgi:hypothetical protein